MTALTALGVAAALALPAAPASAAGYVTFEGTADIACWGCGPSTGTADMTTVGFTTNGGVVNGAAHATYTVQESQVPACGMISIAGTITGSINVSFNAVITGDTVYMSTRGDINGGGTGTFTITSPIGFACGTHVTARITGTIAGA